MEENENVKKSIGILYICTGSYKVFWKNFYDSFQKYFLPGYEKHYYVFTDCEELDEEKNKEVVHCYKIDDQPWPLITLLRFRTFLKVEEELKRHQFLMFSNANMICCDYIYVEEFLPDINKGEKLFFTEHHGYYREQPWNMPLERNKKSLAYVPFQCGNTYVAGGLFGGYTKYFLEMTKILNNRICEDLKMGVIARWHDESHINHYILCNKDYRLLSPRYCYFQGMEMDEKKKIEVLSKQEMFDVNQLKGYYSISAKCSNWTKIKRKIYYSMKIRMFVIRDFLLKREIAK